jgi:hypothetical protein
MSRSNDSASDSTNSLKTGWSRAPRDPDARSDLGYRCVDLQFRRTPGGTDGVVLVVPVDPAPFAPESYLVVPTDVVCDLERMV